MRRNVAVAGYFAFYAIRAAAMYAIAPVSVAWWWCFHACETHPDERTGVAMRQLVVLLSWLVIVCSLNGGPP